MLSDAYENGGESLFNIGIHFSGGGGCLSQNVRVSGDTTNAYVSSQDAYAGKPSAFVLDNGTFKFRNSDTAAQTTVGNAVTLAERLRITSSGRVGIAEDDPDTTLHVKVTSTEGIRLERNGGAISELVNDTDLSTLGTTNNFNLAFKTNNTERARVLTDGGFKINDGDLVIGTAGHGIDFSATSHAAGMTSEFKGQQQMVGQC
jgi:hypothetical protein